MRPRINAECADQKKLEDKNACNRYQRFRSQFRRLLKIRVHPRLAHSS